MAATAANQTPPCARSSWVKRLALKIATLVLLGLLLGFGYDWARRDCTGRNVSRVSRSAWCMAR